MGALDTFLYEYAKELAVTGTVAVSGVIWLFLRKRFPDWKATVSAWVSRHPWAIVILTAVSVSILTAAATSYGARSGPRWIQDTAANGIPFDPLHCDYRWHSDGVLGPFGEKYYVNAKDPTIGAIFYPVIQRSGLIATYYNNNAFMVSSATRSAMFSGNEQNQKFPITIEKRCFE